MKLGIHDRLILLSILPAEGNFLTLKLVRQLREALSFSEVELRDFNIKVNENGGISWENKSDAPAAKEVEIGDKMTELISERLKALDEAEKLTEEHIGLYEQFIKD